MNKPVLIFVMLVAGCGLWAQNQPIFESAVETGQKPWTHLNFYNDPDNFQFAIVTDRNGGSRPGIFEDAVDKLNLLYPEFVLSVGDLINGYTRDTARIRYEWNEVNHIIDDLKMPFFYLPGNHDITNRVMAGEWEKRYGRRYYDFIYKNTLFIILDSNDDDLYNLSREQTDYALETIRRHPEVRWTFLLMHHPIWTYDTHGRFEELESALSGRKYTVLAGHTHHYTHENRKGSNYYILATTGGGSSLRGNYFGEFDHITWVTMTDAGPSLANLRLDGILPHDIAGKETQLLAGVMAENATFEHVMLCNQGDRFTDGTLYFHFKNSGPDPLTIHLQFYHQHQLIIPEPVTELTLEPRENRIVEIPFGTSVPVAYDQAEAIQIDWQMAYDLPEYPGFQLSGRYNLDVAPSKTSFIFPQIPKFLNHLTVSAVHPFSNLRTLFETGSAGGSGESSGESSGEENKIVIEESGDVGVMLVNDRQQRTALESRTYEKVTRLKKASRVKDPEEGLHYSYYEGTWDQLPRFDQLKAITSGIAQDIRVSDYARREDHFGMLLTGYILVGEDGLYIFRSTSDDACRLDVDGEPVVNQDLTREDLSDLGAIALKKGFHPVAIHYMERTGREGLRLFIKKTYDTQWEALEVKGRFYH